MKEEFRNKATKAFMKAENKKKIFKKVISFMENLLVFLLKHSLDKK
ncbi:MAG: hypothetical protein CM15mV98_050 [uncultured marine virus]|nr:MAG: hypothetical protein CM15mV98_050 [uncultured marine virus]